MAKQTKTKIPDMQSKEWNKCPLSVRIPSWMVTELSRLEKTKTGALNKILMEYFDANSFQVYSCEKELETKDRRIQELELENKYIQDECHQLEIDFQEKYDKLNNEYNKMEQLLEGKEEYMRKLIDIMHKNN